LEDITVEDEIEAAYEDGREERAEEIALNALKEGLPVETIKKITGIDTDTINKLQR
jgi:predicted transposase YdaD